MNRFTLTNKILGPCMDVKTDGKRLFAIQRPDGYPGGRLCVLDADGNLLGEYVGLGTARQIEIKDGIAVISARANNLWLFDIREDQPKLLSHYKTIEYAVGVALYANLALISCRQYGVEVIDISDPAHPKHIRTIQTGEVQSACVDNGILYGGIWGTMNVLVIDIRNLNDPKVIADIPLQGRGDGVVVKDGTLYAVTGQHKRGLVSSTDHNDPCFGIGNGVEMFDVSDPANPKFLARREFGYGHNIGFDMWDANIVGDLLLCNDSVCGVHALDTKTFEPKFQLGFDKEDTAATGLTTFMGHLYVSSSDGLYRFDEYTLPDLHHSDSDTVIPGCCEAFVSDSDHLVQRFAGNFPVLSVVEAGESLILACANDGIRIISRDFQEIMHIKTPGMCCDVRYSNGLIYAALAENGLSIYRGKEQIASFVFDEPLLQIDISDSGRYLNCCCGEAYIALLDVSDPQHIRQLVRRDRTEGNIYGSNYLTGRMSDGAMALYWHRDGLFYINPDKGDFDYHNIYYSKKVEFLGYGPENGCDTDGERIFYNLKRNLVLLPKQDCLVDDLPVYAAPDPIHGKLIYHKETIYAAERAKGLVQAFDISDMDHIQTLHYIHTNASCEKPVAIDGRIFIPGWYSGLLELV